MGGNGRGQRSSGWSRRSNRGAGEAISGRVVIQQVTRTRGQALLGKGGSCDAGPVLEPVVLSSESDGAQFWNLGDEVCA